jgi:hypothetical protein
LKRGRKALIAVSVPGNTFFVTTLTLTPIGKEIIGLLPPSEEKYEELALGLKILDQIGRVDLCDIEFCDEKPQWLSRRTLF